MDIIHPPLHKNNRSREISGDDEGELTLGGFQMMTCTIITKVFEL